jgi:hypothetical protein
MASELGPSFRRDFRAWVVLPELRHFWFATDRDILSAFELPTLARCRLRLSPSPGGLWRPPAWVHRLPGRPWATICRPWRAWGPALIFSSRWGGRCFLCLRLQTCAPRSHDNRYAWHVGAHGWGVRVLLSSGFRGLAWTGQGRLHKNRCRAIHVLQSGERVS